MDKKQLTRVILVVLLVAGALGMRHYLSPGQAVRRQLFEAVESLKNEKILGVMAKISRTYSDQWGGSYEGMGGYAQSLMDAYDYLTVDIDISSIEVKDDEARMVLEFVVGGRTKVGRGNILGSESDPCRATLRWVNEEPGWRLVEAEELDIPQLRGELEKRKRR